MGIRVITHGFGVLFRGVIGVVSRTALLTGIVVLIIIVGAAAFLLTRGGGGEEGVIKIGFTASLTGKYQRESA